MEKKVVTVKRIKLAVDVLLCVLYLLLLGYAFTGGQFHELAGIAFAVLAVLHNVLNRRWYKALGKGAYSGKRWLHTLINFALVADLAAILLTGLLGSRYLLHTGLRLPAIGRIHTILALVGLVLIALHIMVHAFARAEKPHRKLLVALTASVCLFAILLDVWLLPYLKRHFLTVEIDRQTAIPGERVAFEDRKILTVYFTRVGNTAFGETVDAVSGASLLLNEDADLMGNSEVIGQMIQDAVGGDILSIHTKKKYPASYAATVSVASEEMKSEELPELIDLPETLDAYDTIFLVYPLWWHTIPKAVESFLTRYEFAGKTLIPVVTHGGGGAGRSLEDIREVCGGTIVEPPLKIYCGDVPDCRNDVTEWLKQVKETIG